MPRISISVGDVVAIPLDEATVGYAQVVAKYSKEGYYFAVFEKAYERSRSPAIADVVADRIALLALSMDALSFTGDWAIVGNTQVAAGLLFPAYKVTVGTPDRVHVVDYSGKYQREASPAEAEMLPYRTTVAPVSLEKAAKALHGFGPWQGSYDKLAHLDIRKRGTLHRPTTDRRSLRAARLAEHAGRRDRRRP